MLKKLQTLLWLVIIIVVIILILNLVGTKEKEGEKSVDIVSVLAETVNISELSTAEFVYNGIAEVYEEDDPEELYCSIRYDSTVKAEVDMSKISFVANEETKEIFVKLPEIKLEVYLVDGVQIQFIPEDAEFDIKQARIICEEDALKEALESDKLQILAEENLKHTVEALLTPVLKDREYTMKWEEQSDV